MIIIGNVDILIVLMNHVIYQYIRYQIFGISKDKLMDIHKTIIDNCKNDIGYRLITNMLLMRDKRDLVSIQVHNQVWFYLAYDIYFSLRNQILPYFNSDIFKG